MTINRRIFSKSCQSVQHSHRSCHSTRHSPPTTIPVRRILALHRLEENIGAAALELSQEDLRAKALRDVALLAGRALRLRGN